MHVSERAIPFEYYRILWLDKKIFNSENSVNLKALLNLGFKGFEPIDDVNQFKQILNGDYSHDNIFVVCSGSMAYDE